MRALTHAEATIVHQLIARSGTRIESISGETSPPRRTAQSIRQRVYARSWIRDRFIPSSILFGRDRMTLGLAEPHADRVESLIERWKSRPENVLLWTSDEVVMGVFLSSHERQSKLSTIISDENSSRSEYFLDVGCHRNSIPVYFDFELAWVRCAGLSGLAGYPRSIFPSENSLDASLPKSLSQSQRKTIEDLVSTFENKRGPLDRSRITYRFLRRRLEDLCLRRGWARFRSFLDPVSVALSVTGFPGWCAVTHGRLLPGARPGDLFRGLLLKARVSPFLFVTDQDQVLFATLSTGPRTDSTEPRTFVMPTVNNYLREIAVVRWPLGGTKVITDHIYGGSTLTCSPPG